jgi:hypothetical protein
MKSEVFLLAAYIKVPNQFYNSHQMDYMEMKNRRRPTIHALEWAMLEEESGKSTRLYWQTKEVDIYKKLNTTNQHKMNSFVKLIVNILIYKEF